MSTPPAQLSNLNAPDPNKFIAGASVAGVLSSLVYIAICAWGLARCNYERLRGDQRAVASLGYFVAMLVTFFLFPPAAFIMAIVAIAILGPVNA